MKFKGRNMPEWFTVNNVDVEGLNLSPSSTNLNGRIGEIFHQQNVGSKTIEVTYTVVGTSISDMRDKVRELQRLLYSKREEKLEFSWEPGVYYNAVLSNMGAPIETRNIAQGTLTFLVPDGSAHSTHLTSTPIGEEIYNSGALEAEGRVIIDVEQPTSSLTLTNGNNVLALGSSEVAPTPQPPFNPQPTVFHDAMESITGWASGSNYEGTATGSIKTNGWSVSIDDPGTGEGWHGPVGVKSFDATQDFFMRVRLGNYKNKLLQHGRIQIYLQDSNGVNQFMVELRNSDPGRFKPMFRVKLGNKVFVDSYGDKMGVWKDFHDGELWIDRRGTRCSFFIGIRRADGSLHTRKNVVYNDVKKEYNRPISRVQFSMMAYSDVDLPSNMHIADIRIREHAKAPANTPQSSIQHFQPGDVVVVDSSTGEISLNGTPAYHLLDPSSSFIKIEPGYNQLVLVEDNKATGRIEFRERW